MSFRIGQTPDRDDLDQYPKVERQHALAAACFPVPPGVVLDLATARTLRWSDPACQDPAVVWVRDQIAAGHALIARSAGSREDRSKTSGAGLGMSVPRLRDARALEGALALIEAHGRTLTAMGQFQPGPPGVEKISAGSPRRGEFPSRRGDPAEISAERTLMLIQREVPRRALLVVVRGGDPSERFYMEVHGQTAGPEPLAEGRSPDWAGPLRDWDDPARDAVEQLAAAIAERESGPDGVDLEIVVDHAGVPWLVQARPLTAPLEPGWPAFAAAVAEEGQAEVLARGSLILDGEHNPAPLSVAHAWVMRRLTQLRPDKAGDPVVLAGWLYVRTLPRDLDRRAHDGTYDDRVTIEILSARKALAWLRDEALPKARAGLVELDALLATGPSVRVALARAEALFLAMIDAYVGRLVPARAAALARTAGVTAPEAPRPLADPSPGSDSDSDDTPLSLRARAEFLDVLPAVWDIASPSLAELLTAPAASQGPSALPTSEHEAARLLGEWDDHLFACGLAPLRRVWLYAAERLGLDRERVFSLAGDELIELDEGRPVAGQGATELDAVLADRAARAEAQRRLEPPSRIVDGHPIPHPFGGRLRGLAIGDSFEGPVAQRRDLRDLLADPPPAGAVLCIPALTAQAAVALVQLGIRAVCTEFGGALAHGALMARELGLSALIGCKGCTQILEGTRVRVDTKARRLL